MESCSRDLGEKIGLELANIPYLATTIHGELKYAGTKDTFYGSCVSYSEKCTGNSSGAYTVVDWHEVCDTHGAHSIVLQFEEN